MMMMGSIRVKIKIGRLSVPFILSEQIKINDLTCMELE